MFAPPSSCRVFGRPTALIRLLPRDRVPNVFPRMGAGQVRLLPVERWSHAAGLTEWKVPAPDFNQSYESYGSPEEVLDPALWCRNGGALAATMFPPADPQAGSANVSSHSSFHVFKQTAGARLMTVLDLRVERS